MAGESGSRSPWLPRHLLGGHPIGGLEGRFPPLVGQLKWPREDERFLDQPGQQIEGVFAADRFRRMQRAAAREDGKPAEQRLRFRAEEITAPADQRPRRLVVW